MIVTPGKPTPKRPVGGGALPVLQSAYLCVYCPAVSEVLSCVCSGRFHTKFILCAEQLLSPRVFYTSSVWGWGLDVADFTFRQMVSGCSLQICDIADAGCDVLLETSAAHCWSSCSLHSFLTFLTVVVCCLFYVFLGLPLLMVVKLISIL